MDINKILEVRLYNPSLTDYIDISRKNNYGLLLLEGIDSGEVSLGMNENVLFDGSILSNRRLTHRNIVLEAEFKGNEKLEERKRVIKFFNLHHNAFFYIKYGNDEYKIPYVVEEFKAPIPNVNYPFRFYVSLICPDPFFSDVQNSDIAIVEWKKALSFPLKISMKRGFVFGRKKDMTETNVYNKGDVATGFIITFSSTGEVVDPHIINVSTREKIEVKKTMMQGEMFIVNTNPGQKGVEMINSKDGNNGYRFLSNDSEFFQLAIGDNIIKFGAKQGINNLKVGLQFTNKYLGV